MNNKGFTLVELLAVIVILSSISLIVMSSISASLERRDVKECEEQIELAKNAAKIYFSINDCMISTSGDSCDVDISVLKSGNYFNEKSKTDRLKDDYHISMTMDGYKYKDRNGNVAECK